MHMLCSRNLSVLVQCELQVDRIKIHVMQLRVINSGGMLRLILHVSALDLCFHLFPK